MTITTPFTLQRDHELSVIVSGTYEPGTGPDPDEAGGFEDICAVMDGREVELTESEAAQAEEALWTQVLAGREG